MPSLAETRALVEALHADQVDKSGAPYIQHLERVHAHLVRLFPDATEAEQHAAFLHDSLEDTAATVADLRARGYGDDILTIVQMMTKPEGADYLPYVRKLADAGNPSAIRVKLADNADNSDPMRLALLPEEQRMKLLAKYTAARHILRAAIDRR